MDINPYLERMRKAEDSAAAIDDVANQCLEHLIKAEAEQLKRYIWAAAFAAEFVRQIHTQRVTSPAFCFDAADRAVKALESAHDLVEEDLHDESK